MKSNPKKEKSSKELHDIYQGLKAENRRTYLSALYQNVPNVTTFILKSDSARKAGTTIAGARGQTYNIPKPAIMPLLWLSVVLSAVNLVHSSASLLYKLYTGEKKSITLSEGVNLGVSSLIIGLGVVMVLFPVLVLPLALAATFINIGSSLINVGNRYYQFLKAQDVLPKVKQEINEKEIKIAKLLKEMKDLEENENLGTVNTSAKLHVQNEIENHITQLGTLYKLEKKYQQRIDNYKSTLRNNIIEIILFTLGLAATIVLLANPLGGSLFAAGVTLAACAYYAGPFLKSGWDNIKSWITNSKSTEEIVIQKDSSSKILNGLGKEKSTDQNINYENKHNIGHHQSLFSNSIEEEQLTINNSGDEISVKNSIHLELYKSLKLRTLNSVT